MKTLIFCCCALLFVTGAAAQKTIKPAAKPAAKTVVKPAGNTAAVTKSFSNGITMKIKGFTVAEAGLYYEDGTKVPEDNTVELNQKVIMYTVLDGGYKVTGGKVFPGSSERIVLSNGYEVLKTDDLFAEYNSGISPEDGKYISLKAMMTEIDDKSMDITVSFKIWDKKGTSLITGSYKLKVK